MIEESLPGIDPILNHPSTVKAFVPSVKAALSGNLTPLLPLK